MTLSRNRDEEERLLRQFGEQTGPHSLLDAAQVLRYREEAYQRLNDSEQMREYTTPGGQQYWVGYPYDRGEVNIVHYAPTIERRNRYEYQRYNRIEYNYDDLLERFPQRNEPYQIFDELMEKERKETEGIFKQILKRYEQKEKGETIAKQQKKIQRPKLPEL